MDLPTFHHHREQPHLQHNHHSPRYGNVLHLPNFTPPPFYQRHLPPPTPPLPLPISHHLLPPLPPHHILHDPRPPPPPDHFTFSQPHTRTPRENPRLYEFDGPCSPPSPRPPPPPPIRFNRPPHDRWTDPTPHPPMARENFPLRPIDNYEDPIDNYQGRMFRDELFVDNRGDGYGDNNNDMSDVWDQDFPWDARKSNVLDMEDTERYYQRFGSRPERDFNPDKSRGYEPYNERDGGNRRWERNINERGLFHLQDIQEVSRGNHTLGRFCGRLGSGDQEFIRSPRKKQVQKKSALLRIQLGKAGNRKRGHDYFSKELSSSSFRGKEKEGFVLSQKKLEETERERSPVELDVSFKSNALVAKAIAASSSPAVKSNGIVKVRNRLIRKVNSISGSPLTKSSAISARELDFQYATGKSPKRSTEKVVHESRSANGINDGYLGDNAVDKESLRAMDSDQAGNIDGSDRTPNHRLRKKNKINMRLLCESSPQSTKDSFEIINANTCANSSPAVSLLDEDTVISEGNVAAAGFDTVHDTVSLSPSNEINVGKSEEQLDYIVSEKNGTDSNSSNHFVSNSKTKRSSLTVFSASSCMADDAITDTGYVERSLAAKNDDHAFLMESYEEANPADGMTINENSGQVIRLDSSEHADKMDKLVHSVLNFETSAIDFHNQFTVSGTKTVDDVREQPLQDELISPDNGPTRGLLEVTVSVEDHDTSGLSRPEETQEVQGDMYASKIEDVCNSLEADFELFKKAENCSVCSLSFKGAGSKDSYPNQAIVPQGGVLGSLNAEEIRFTISADNADNSTFSSGTATSFKPTTLLENNLVACLNSDHSPKTKRKRNARDSHMGLSAAKTYKMPVDVVSSLGGEERKFLVTDIISVEEVDIPPCDPDISGDGKQSKEGPFEVEVSAEDGLDLGANGLLPGYSKKRKVLSPRSSCPSLWEVSDGSEAADTVSLLEEVPSNSNIGTIQPESGIMPPVTHNNSSVCLSPCSTQIVTLSEISVGEKSFSAYSFGGDLTSDCTKLDWNSSNQFETGVDKRKDTLTVASTAIHHRDMTDMVSKISGEISDTLDMGESYNTLSDGENRSENNLCLKDDLAFVRNNTFLFADGNDFSADELMDSGPDLPSRINSPEVLFSNSNSCLLRNTQESPIQLTDEIECGEDKMSNENAAAYPTSLVSTSVKKASSDHFETKTKSSPSLSQNTSKLTPHSSLVCEVSNSSKSQLTSAVRRGFPGHPASSFNTPKRAIPSAHVTKSRTWLRTGNPSAVVARPELQSRSLHQSHVHKTVGNNQSSYIRKGNSLVRKPSLADISHGLHASSSSGHRLSPSRVNNSKNQASENKIEDIDPPSLCKTGVKIPSERPEAFPLAHSVETLNCAALNLGESESLPVANPPSSGSPSTPSDLLEDTIKSSAITECQPGSGNNSDSQSTLDEGNSGMKIIYVKRRSYQLVAASDSEDPPIQGVDKTTQGSSSDSYYKRRKHQLIRTPMENNVKKGDASAVGSFDSHKLGTRRVTPGKSVSKRQSGFPKTEKASKFSLVWKLCDTQSTGKDNISVRRQKVWPYLFPWKRATYWKNFMHSLGSTPDNSSLPTISRKLLLSRKRGAIYTRSTRGFSLRISKVLSVGGSSLKWSKSIDRNSKKANEDATRAVAAAEKRKKEQNVVVPAILKNRNRVLRKSVVSVKLHPGERIFRIGSERYKMDSTRKTLQRITADEEPPDSVILKSGKKIKNSYVPRRLLVGNEEYVRIGNGNQLVRDPKKRTRILASEKVRWSLHTARLRLTKKRKYCQFFTRFGKCNKDDGKCLYIHDLSKIAVCTKFLKGSCSNLDCKLTHKVIPERMQDCSYFLQGLCSNQNCPYRHVIVNSNSPVCESFLRGYCADGDECRKKHTYVCPAFEATGICPEGSKCKLHHPKGKRGMKRKFSSGQNNVGGRYFDSGPMELTENPTSMTEKLYVKGNDDIGELADYISLDVSDDEVEDTIASSSKQAGDHPTLEVQVIDLDDLIKPILIMNQKHTTNPSPAIDGTREMASFV